MAKINLNELPDELPGSSPVFPNGKYKVTIVKASMQSPKDPTKKMYLTVQYNVVDLDNDAPVGKFWDKFYDSDNQYVQFKLKKFIKALNLPIGADDEFELTDLEKMINMKEGKSIMADFSLNDKDGKNEMQIDLFSGQAYYPTEGTETQPEPKKAPSETPVLEADDTDDSDY